MATARAEPADQPLASEPGEAPVLHEGTDNVLLQLIVFQGFLVEFNTPDVHRAFLRGEFGVPENDERMLDTIRHICRMLLPPLRPRVAGGRGVKRSEVALSGLDLFEGLLRKAIVSRGTMKHGLSRCGKPVHNGLFI
jgi:hypothetical protein